jgi:hypothetical protein
VDGHFSHVLTVIFFIWSIVKWGVLTDQYRNFATGRKLSMYMAVLTQLYLQKLLKESTTCFGPYGRAIIRLSPESPRKFIHYNVCYTARAKGERDIVPPTYKLTFYKNIHTFHLYFLYIHTFITHIMILFCKSFFKNHFPIFIMYYHKYFKIKCLFNVLNRGLTMA